ncbi:hypothetical protein C9I99_12220 [Photobacterium lutimaris]|uniref:Uncharacterized protein n=1 Tax=Photobacterium lutimaris TaxID=388278 RepID=A0A2T3IY68_9GAMM|nr:hypothetical protein C9I99_12220 [Photobacterium lutimaris]
MYTQLVIPMHERLRLFASHITLRFLVIEITRNGCEKCFGYTDFLREMHQLNQRQSPPQDEAGWIAERTDLIHSYIAVGGFETRVLSY